jgi:hypothetical protein
VQRATYSKVPLQHLLLHPIIKEKMEKMEINKKEKDKKPIMILKEVVVKM